MIKALEELVIGKDRLKIAEWDEDNKLRLDSECYLTAEEIVLLILGALLHDIGMSLKVNIKGKDEKDRRLLELNREAREILKEMSEEYEDMLKKLKRGEGNRKELWKRLRELENMENPELKELREKIRENMGEPDGVSQP